MKNIIKFIFFPLIIAVHIFLSFIGLNLSIASASESNNWQVVRKLELPDGAYQISTNERYALIGYLINGMVSVVDLKQWRVLNTKAWGVGQTYIAISQNQALIALTSMRQLLLVEFPSFKLLRRYDLSFYPYGVNFATKSLERRGASSPDFSSNSAQPSTKLDITYTPRTSPHRLSSTSRRANYTATERWYTPNPTRAIGSNRVFSTSRPNAASSTTCYGTAIIANYTDNQLISFDLDSGQVVQRKTFNWPLRTRWSKEYGIVISMTRSLALIQPHNLHTMQTLQIPGIVGDVVIDNNFMMLVYGDDKNKDGSMQVYRLPQMELLLTRPLFAIPRGIAISKDYIFSLTASGWLQIHHRNTGKLQQNLRIGNSGIALTYTNHSLIALLPTENKLVSLSQK